MADFLSRLLNPNPIMNQSGGASPMPFPQMQPQEMQRPGFGQNFKSNIGPILQALGIGIASGNLGTGAALLPTLTNSRQDRQLKIQEQQAEQQQKNQTIQWLKVNDPETATMLERGMIDGKTAIARAWQKQQAAGDGNKAPDVVEIFDEQGRPRKAMWNGKEYVPLGGSKAPPSGAGIRIGEDGQLVYDTPWDAKNAANVMTDERALASSATKLKDTIKIMRGAQGNAGYTGIGGGAYDAVDQGLEAISGGRVGLPGDPAARAVIKSGGLKFVLDNVAATKGAISNSEMDLFAQAAPGLQTTPEGNKRLLDIADKVADRQIQRVQELERWRKENGTVDGFEAAWADYVEKNPILTPDMFGAGPAPAQERTTPSGFKYKVKQ